MSMYNPIKEENDDDDDVVIISDPGWDIRSVSLVPSIVSYCVLINDKTLDRVIAELNRAVEVLGTQIANRVVVRDKLVHHLFMLHAYHSETELTFIKMDNYYDIMEDLFVKYLTLELQIIKCNNAESLRICSQRIIQLMMLVFDYKEEHCLHILLKLNIPKLTSRMKSLLNIIYNHFLRTMSLPSTWTDELFCRHYLLMQKWKDIYIGKEQKVFMDRFLLQRFNKETSDIEESEFLRSILIPRYNNGNIEATIFALQGVMMCIKLYFEHMKKKRNTQSNSPVIYDNSWRDVAIIRNEPTVSFSRLNPDCTKSEFSKMIESIIKCYSEETKMKKEFEDIDVNGNEGPHFVLTIEDDDDLEIVEPKKITSPAKEKKAPVQSPVLIDPFLVVDDNESTNIAMVQELPVSSEVQVNGTSNTPIYGVPYLVETLPATSTNETQDFQETPVVMTPSSDFQEAPVVMRSSTPDQVVTEEVVTTETPQELIASATDKAEYINVIPEPMDVSNKQVLIITEAESALITSQQVNFLLSQDLIKYNQSVTLENSQPVTLETSQQVALENSQSESAGIMDDDDITKLLYFREKTEESEKTQQAAVMQESEITSVPDTIYPTPDHEDQYERESYDTATSFIMHNAHPLVTESNNPTPTNSTECESYNDLDEMDRMDRHEKILATFPIEPLDDGGHSIQDCDISMEEKVLYKEKMKHFSKMDHIENHLDAEIFNSKINDIFSTQEIVQERAKNNRHVPIDGRLLPIISSDGIRRDYFDLNNFPKNDRTPTTKSVKFSSQLVQQRLIERDSPPPAKKQCLIDSKFVIKLEDLNERAKYILNHMQLAVTLIRQSPEQMRKEYDKKIKEKAGNFLHNTTKSCIIARIFKDETKNHLDQNKDLLDTTGLFRRNGDFNHNGGYYNNLPVAISRNRKGGRRRRGRGRPRKGTVPSPTTFTDDFFQDTS